MASSKRFLACDEQAGTDLTEQVSSSTEPKPVQGPPDHWATNTGTATAQSGYEQWHRRFLAAEFKCAWLDECDEAHRFLAINRELVQALAQTLRPIVPTGTILEVCAGNGELARELTTLGVRVQATDVARTRAANVLQMDANEALLRFHPTVVLGVFVPFDSGVDEAVMACPTVQHYVVLNARLGGAFGSASLWNNDQWRYKPLAAVARWMITRHDLCLSGSEFESQMEHNILRHGEAWCFTRRA